MSSFQRDEIAALKDEITRLSAAVARLAGQHAPDCEIHENESARTDRAGMCDCGYVEHEIVRLNAALARVRGQRDKALIDVAVTKHDVLFPDRPMANVVTLADHGFRVLDRDGVRTVEEIES